MSTDNRSQTDDDLRQAFWRLYRDKGIDKISIRELTEKAGYNRGTFYLHYTDIHDLLQRVEDDLLDQVRDCVLGYDLSLSDADPIALMQQVLELYHQNSEKMVVLFGPRGDPTFTLRLRELMKQMPFWRISQGSGDITGTEQDLLLEQTVTGVLYMIASWLADPRDITAERLLHLIYDSAIRQRG